jgi:Mn2+/Fe2+ NRAMP family transporter
VAWVPWAWYAVNIVKDFFLRGGIVAIAGLICYDALGPLPLPLALVNGAAVAGATDQLQTISWTLLNYGLIWLLLVVGGYRLAEALNIALSLIFTFCLAACAVAVLPQATGELLRGMRPRVPSGSDELLMLVSLAGIVMSGSTTVYYSAWAEERRMGMFDFVRRTGCRLSRQQIEPQSAEEVRRMAGWIRVNRVNVAVTYFLGALICLSTFILGVAVLRPAGVTLRGAQLAPELSLMMTQVAGPWAKPVFYLGAYAAVVSTAIGVLDGGSRMYTQPLRRKLPALVERVSPVTCQRIIMTLMVAGCWLVYVLVPDALKLVIWMGAIDAPLVGILIIAYAYLGKWYLPRAYRRGTVWVLVMTLIGSLYLGLGVYAFGKLTGM